MLRNDRVRGTQQRAIEFPRTMRINRGRKGSSQYDPLKGVGTADTPCAILRRARRNSKGASGTHLGSHRGSSPCEPLLYGPSITVTSLSQGVGD